MAATYEPIATTTLGSAAATITFSSIPATYTDLRLVIIGTATTNGDYAQLRFNSDTATNYASAKLIGNGTTASSGGNYAVTGMDFWGFSGTTGISNTIPSMGTADIFSYAGFTNKTVLMSNAIDKNGSGAVSRQTGMWRGTSQINTIDIVNRLSTFAAGTTATLYGIKKA